MCNVWKHGHSRDKITYEYEEVTGTATREERAIHAFDAGMCRLMAIEQCQLARRLNERKALTSKPCQGVRSRRCVEVQDRFVVYQTESCNNNISTELLNE